MDAARQRARMMRMIAASVVCFLVAAGSFVGYVAGDIAILGPVFVAAIAAGVAAQIWFIVGAARDGQAPARKA
jgi:hypothetical protein